MAHPFSPTPDSPALQLQLLIAASGGLSGDGQLRELMQERRRHLHSPSGGLWYLPPGQMRKLGQPDGVEGLVIQEAGAAIWLQLRFGGELRSIALGGAALDRQALGLPAPAVPAAVR